MAIETATTGEMLRADRLAASPDLLLHRFDFERRACVFLEACADSYADSAFLDHRVAKAGTRLHGVDFRVVAELLARASPRAHPPHFIAHTSFCCSTLLARSLAFDERSLVLREPQSLLLLAREFRRNPDRFPARARHAYLGLALRLLNKAYHPEQRVILKPSNLANRLLPDWLAMLPFSRGVLITCGLEDYLVSVLRKTRETLDKMSWVCRSLAADSDYLVICPELDRNFNDPLRAAAVAWHAQQYLFAGLLARHRGRMLVFDQSTLLDRPVNSLAAACAHLDLPVTEEEIRARVHGRLWQRNAKDPRLSHSPAARRAAHARVRAMQAHRVGRAVEWLAPFLARLPDPLAPFMAPETPQHSSRAPDGPGLISHA